jgi:hypothetical protein
MLVHIRFVFIFYKLDLNHNVNHEFESGIYYLRIQVDWVHHEILK